MKLKNILLVCLLMNQLFSNATTISPVLINIENAGTLRSILGNRIDSINDLTLTGYINGSDIIILRNMDSLKVLNLANANIVSGGEMYYSNHQTTNNVFGAYFFYECSGLKSIILPDSITEIGANAFWGCSSLTSIIIPHKVASIGDFAFFGCTSLTSLDITDVTYIGKDAFASCESMTSIVMPKNLSSIDEFTFTNCLGLSNITIPDGVTSIGYSAFVNCKGLSSITLPSSLNSIGNYAFYGCKGLKAIHCEMIVPPAITSELFTNVDFSSSILYVPIGAYQVYRSAAGWGDFANIIEGDLTPLPNNKIANIKIYTEQDVLYVQGVKLGDVIAVYSINGVLIKKIKATTDRVRINITSKNVYLIKAGKETYKIAI